MTVFLINGTLTVGNIINDDKIIKRYANKRAAKQGFENIVNKIIHDKEV